MMGESSEFTMRKDIKYFEKRSKLTKNSDIARGERTTLSHYFEPI